MVAAIGVVAGSVVDDTSSTSRQETMIEINGTDEGEAPYSDPPEATAPTPLVVAAAPPSVRFWSTTNKCQFATAQRQSPHVTRVQFAPCAGADVVSYSIDGGG